MSQYGSFGIANKRMVPRLSKLRGLLFGFPQSGKTSLVASNPAALIINFDLSSTPIARPDSPPSPAQFFPAIGEEGKPIDANGQPFIFNWASVLKLIDSLIEASKKNAPRPEMIVFDSLTSLFNLLQDAALANFRKDSWDEGRKDVMWDWVYNQLSSALRDIQDAGYGIWIIAHLTNYKVRTESSNIERVELQAYPGFIRRFYGMFELCVGCERTSIPVARTIKVPMKMADGREATIEKTITEEVYGYRIKGDDPKVQEAFRHRIPLPNVIDLPELNPWQVFEQKYREVVTPQPSQPTKGA